jgi:serine/threonine-protein kinase
MFLDEARLASRIQQANVVPVLDMHAEDGELLLVMEYVAGESLVRLRRAATSRGEPVPLEITCAILVGTLLGLHAAHEARNENGEPLDIVHRDVSPHNVIVGADGVARVIDFGIAKATGRLQETREGQLKGKLPYMAPEQILARPLDRRSDVYSASMVLWFMLTGELPFTGAEASMLYDVLHKVVPPPSAYADVPAELDALTMRGLSRDPRRRFATALEMAEELQCVVAPATPLEVAAWVERLAGDALRHRAAKVAAVEAIQGVAPVRQLPPSGPDAAEGASSSGERRAVELEVSSTPSHTAERSLTRWALGTAGATAMVMAVVVPIALLAGGRQTETAPAAPDNPPAPSAEVVAGPETQATSAPPQVDPEPQPASSTAAPAPMGTSTSTATSRATPPPTRARSSPAAGGDRSAAPKAEPPPLPGDSKYGF